MRPTSNAPTVQRDAPTGGNGKAIKSSPIRHSESISTKRIKGSRND